MRLSTRILQVLLLPLIATIGVSEPASAACGLIPSPYVLASGNGGLKLGDDISVNGIAVTGVTSGNNAVLSPDGIVSVASLTLPDLSPADFPSNPSNQNRNFADDSDTTLHAADETFFNRIRVGEDATLRLTGDGPVHIDDLILGDDSTLILSAGIYYIDDLILGDDARLIASDPAVIIHIDSNFAAGENSLINAGGGVTDLQIMLHRNAKLDVEEDSRFTGVVYGPEAGNIDFGEDARFRGSIISGGKIDFEEDSILTLTEADQIAIASLSTCTGVSLGSFLVEPANLNASTCLPLAVDITALDQDGAVFADYTGSIALSTSSGHGSWQSVDNTNPLGSGGADTGAATYTFAAADGGSIRVNLSNQHAESLFVTVADSAAGISSNSAVVVFGDNVLVVSGLETFTHPVAGRNHNFKLEFHTRDASSPPAPAVPTAPCSVATDYAGARSLKAWFQATPRHPAAAAAPALQTAPGVTSLLPPGEPGGSNLTLDFVAGRADFVLQTTDVGQFSLWFADASLGFADVPVYGASGTLTVRPLGLKILTQNPIPPPPITTPQGNLFAAAGEVFGITISAVRWQDPSDDLDANGNLLDTDDLLDNNLPTSAFAETTALSAILVTPVGGSAGALSRTTGALPVTAGEFSSGTAQIDDLSYGEVGSMRLSAAASDFLGSGLIVPGGSAVIGRFKPHHFEFSLLNAPDWQAACTAFTYLGQDFDFATPPQVRLSAHNLQHGVTANYTDHTASGGLDWWAPVDAELSLSLSDAGAPAGIAPQFAVGGLHHSGIGVPSGPGYVDLTLTGPFRYAKPAPASHASGGGYAPFDSGLTLTLSYAGADGADSGDLAIAPPETLGASQVRHGRLRLDNAHGSELLDLAVPLWLEHFDATAWRLAGDDLCTLALQPDDFTFVPAARPADSFQPFIGGAGLLIYRCAGGGCAPGVIDLVADLDDLLGAGSSAQAWLKYDWDGDGVEQNPAARAALGVYQGNSRQIFLREQY